MIVSVVDTPSKSFPEEKDLLSHIKGLESRESLQIKLDKFPLSTIIQGVKTVHQDEKGNLSGRVTFYLVSKIDGATLHFELIDGTNTSLIPTISKVLEIIQKVLSLVMVEGTFLTELEDVDLNILDGEEFEKHSVIVGKNNLAYYAAIKTLLSKEEFTSSLLFLDSDTNKSSDFSECIEDVYRYLESMGTCFHVRNLRA